MLAEVLKFMVEAGRAQEPSESQVKVQVSLAASLHEVVAHIGAGPGVEGLLKALLESEQEEVQRAVARNLHKTLSRYWEQLGAAGAGGYRRELAFEGLLHSVRVLESSLKRRGWREHVELVGALPRLQLLFGGAPAFCDAFYAHLWDYMRHGFRDTKLAAAEAFARLLHNDFRSGVRAKFMRRVVEEFRHSPSCYDRALFVHFCGVAAEAYSRALFHDYGLYEAFLGLAADGVVDVQLRFLETAPAVRKALSAEDDTHSVVRLLDCIALLTNSELKRVSDAAIDCELQLSHAKYRDPTIVAKLDQENRSKLSHERNLELLEKEAELEQQIARANQRSASSLFSASASFAAEPAPPRLPLQAPAPKKPRGGGPPKKTAPPPRWPLSVSPLADSKAGGGGGAGSGGKAGAAAGGGDKTFSSFISDAGRRNSSYSKK